ncbi:putative cytochrome P450 [Xylariaceae sp. FL0016]|nr:putative cytochrome P450 [Xylariaceae sp. FL0016]
MHSLATLGVGLLVLLAAGRLVQHLLKTGNALGLPPGPKPAPIIGNLFQVPKSLQWFHFYHWSKNHGPIMHLSMAGQPLIILSTNEAVQELMNRRGAQYSDRPRLVMAGELVTKGMHMLLRPYDERYRLHQRMEAPLLNPRAANCYRPIQDLESKQLLFDIFAEVDKSESSDFHHHFQRAMASTIYSLIYGYRFKTGHEQELVDAFHVQAEFARTGQVGAYIVDTLPFLNHLPRALAPWKKEGEALYELERKLHVGNLETGLRNPGWNWAKYMVDCTEAKGMSTEELAFDLGIMADAALDTSTVALTWLVVAWVVHGSQFIAKAQKLLDEIVGADRMPTFDDRPQLAYIDAIACETLRWRPVVVGGVPHMTKTEDTFRGYRIPAGSIVMGNAFAITRDESAFGADVDSFIPERWIDKDGNLKELPQSGFGFARRICTGRHIARNGLFIEIARVLWAFDIEEVVTETGEPHIVDDMACTEGFVTCPKPFRVKFRQRGPWVRDVILAGGSTHIVDHVEILNKAGADRRAKKPGA